MVKSEEVDRIGALSDVLLALILSFLSMKDVVKTSILCRRWKNIWTQVPILDFSGLNVSPSLLPSFKAFVYKALLLNDAPLLRRFSMDHLNGIEDFHVNSWVWTLMNRNVVKISLGPLGSFFKHIQLVGAIFSSETLRVLKLNGRFILPSVVPSQQHLPKLELLHLVDVTFEQNDTLPVLLSVCPRLKQLLLDKSTPKCFSSSLRYVQMNGFCGYGSHLKLAEYILTYAEVLKVIKIYTANEDWDKEMNGLMQLFSVNRASTHCEFTIGVP